MDDILDFSKPVDVAAFDRVVAALSSSAPETIMRAQEVLVAFKSHPDAYMRVDKLLTDSQSTHTRFFALQVLEETILQRWNVLSDANKHAIRAFVMQLIVSECTSLPQMRARRALLAKMNSTLVSIAKREWPVRWPSFVQDVATSAGPQHPMVENSLNLLRLVAEEVFEFSSTSLTSRWVERKKRALADDFHFVMELCATVLLAEYNTDNSRNAGMQGGSIVDSQLQKAAMQTFCVYVPWMQPVLVFNAQVLERLSQLVVGDDHVRVVAVRCLAEVCLVERDAGAAGDAQAHMLVDVVAAALRRIAASLPTAHSALMERIVQLYEDNNSGDVDQAYVSALAELLTQFMRRYYAQVAYDDALLAAVHDLLIGMSNINDKELFKVCVEYWWWLGHMLLYAPASSAKHSLAVKLQRALSDVRFVLVRRMAKPEEVVLVEEDGELRREHMADVEELQLYALMRDALTFLTRLDYKDTRNIITTLMLRLLDRSEWSWHNCNVLSWSVGAIAEAVQSEGNNEMFYTIVRGLLRLCRDMSTKADRAVIIGNVMFVIGQYPRFLLHHAPFLFTVTQKLYDFLRESFPGVQDMAVDTLNKLAQRCAAAYVLRPPFKTADTASTAAAALTAANKSFAEASAARWTAVTSMLSPSQIQSCFRAAGCMVAAEEASRQAELLQLFLYDTNVSFRQLSERAMASVVAFCGDATLLAELLHYLRIFSSMASTCGDAFIHEMSVIIQDLYAYYRAFAQVQRDAARAAASSSSLTAAQQQQQQQGQPDAANGHASNNNDNNVVNNGSGGNSMTRQETAKQLRLCKREILRVFAQFVTHTAHVDFVATQCMPEVFAVVLTDYAADEDATTTTAAAAAATTTTREPEVLALVTSCVNTLRASLAGDCAAILDHTFAPTVVMLARSRESFPDFRVGLFKLLQALNTHCFDAYVRYAATHEDVIGAMLWAITHTDYPTMSTGLQTLDTFLCNVAASDFAQTFYTAYMERILVEVLVTAMDSLHAAGFTLHCAILMRLFAVSALVPEDAPVLGRAAVSAFLLRSLTVIPTLSEASIGEFVAMCYSCYADEKAFRTRMADFLIEVRIWGAEQENRLQQQQEEEEQRQLTEAAAAAASLSSSSPGTPPPPPPPRLRAAPASRSELLQQRQQQQQQQAHFFPF